MTSERWQQVKEVMALTLQAAPPDRARIVDELCRQDNELKCEVISLLAAVRDEDNASAPDELRAVVVAEARSLTRARTRADVDTLRASLQHNLSDNYDILSTLGVGGMGAVFLARERALDRYVAIKVLRAEQSMTKQSQERFRREARIAAQLSHPGILPLHAFGEVAGMWYLVMGYVSGQSLAQRMQTDGRLPPTEVWRIMRALSEALEHAHARHVIHRDIKPANILIDSESARPMLGDFGISKMLGDVDALTQAGDLLGTPHYMSPEQIANPADCDERSDVYALGAVAYAMLSGRSPLAESADSDGITRRATSTIVPLERIGISVAPDFAAVVMRCLAPSSDDRWASARALRDALDRVDQNTDAAVPIALREVDGFGAYAFAWMIFWLVHLVDTHSNEQRAVLVLVALLVPIGLALNVASVASPSLRRMQLVQVAFWPPLWWGMWWPASLRRPGDIWKRLPVPAKTVRAIMSIFTVSLPVLTANGNGFAWIGHPDESGSNWYLAVEILAGAALVSLISTIVWARTKALSSRDAIRFLLGSTAPSAFWQRRDIARLLRLTRPGIRPPDVQLPADYVRAIEELRQWIASDVVPSIQQPIVMARRIVSAIVDLDREIAALGRDAPASEFARLADRLSTLQGTPPPLAHAEQHRALIELVNSEIALLRRIQQRQVLAQGESRALFDILRALWAELQLLTDSPGDHSNTDTRIRNLIEKASGLLAPLAI